MRSTLATTHVISTSARRVVALRNAPVRLVARAQAQGLADNEAGMTTAEYAVGTVAACGFAGVLYKVVTSPTVLDVMKSVITKAFDWGF